MPEGNKHIGYKEAINEIEATSPGSKQAFYFGFLARAVERFADASPGHGEGDAASCERCGVPTTSEICTFCRLLERTSGAEPVQLTRKGKVIA